MVIGAVGLHGQTVTSHAMEDPRQEHDCVTILNQLMVGETVRAQQQRVSLVTLILVQVCMAHWTQSNNLLNNGYMNFLSLNCVIKKYTTVLGNIITFEDATYAPINVNPVGAGGFDAWDYPPCRAFDRAKRPRGRDIWLWPTEAWYQFRSGYQVCPSRLSESHTVGERCEVFQ